MSPATGGGFDSQAQSIPFRFARDPMNVNRIVFDVRFCMVAGVGCEIVVDRFGERQGFRLYRTGVTRQ